MSILDHSKLVIYSFPRAATKLLAQVLTDSGYHNYGEWYDVWASENVGATTKRQDHKQLQKTQYQSLKDYDRLHHDLLAQLIQRRQHWVNVNAELAPPRWTITLWPNNLADFPFLLDLYKDCTWLCATRDPWQQLLSWCVSNVNQNFDGARNSHLVRISQPLFQRWYWQLRRLELHQQWITQNLSSYTVPFDQLVSGNYTGFGKPYTVDSKDEHHDIESLVKNIDEVRTWWDQLTGSP